MEKIPLMQEMKKEASKDSVAVGTSRRRVEME